MKDFRMHSLELKDYNRLKPNSIQRIKIDMANPYQIIIGTNGSGKSSVMKECTPLPANPKEFGPSGHKIVLCSSGGQYYKLVNDFKTKTHYFYLTDSTFEMELDNLNPSGNISTQRKLALDTFGYDAEIASVLLQDHDYRFTRMSKNMRKEWMLRLGNINLEFAIKLHRTLKQKHNEQIAIVKHLKRRIGDEEIRRISDEEISELKRKANMFTDELTELMSAIIPNTQNLTDIKSNMRMELNRLNGLANVKPISSALLLNPTLINLGDIQADPQSYIAAMSARIRSIQEQAKADDLTIDRLYKESSRIRDLIATLHSNSAKTVADLQNELAALEREHTALSTTCRFEYKEEYVTQAMITRYDFKQDMESLVYELIENPEDYLNRERYNVVTLDQSAIVVDIANLDKEIMRTEHQLEHMAKHDATQCPKCKHSWYPITSATPEELTERLRTYNDKRAGLVERSNRNAEYIQAFESRRGTLVKINDMKHRSEHAVFIAHLVNNEYWTKSNTWILQEIQYWFAECQTNIELQKLCQRRDILTAAVATAAEVKPDDITSERIGQLDAEINELLHGKDERAVESSLLTAAAQQLGQLQQDHQTGLGYVHRLATLLEQLVESSINDQINTEIRDRQTVLSTIQSALQSAESIITILNSLEADLVKAKSDLQVFGILEEELSPTRGVIAEYITDFIRLFTDQLNAVIKQIWNQRLEVLPCGFDLESDSGELDYRFPIMTGMETGSDISKGSSAQRDMIDFAFVMVTYLYSGMSHYPLYIDELAPTMDDLHRVRITQYVKQLMENNHHSQMFMISHYISGHGVFANADYCILSETNILHKPKEFNKHVIIE